MFGCGSEKMNFLLILFLVSTHQNIVNGEFSKIVHLLDYAETDIKEIKLNAATMMDNVANQLKKLLNDMQAESLSYINDGIQTLQQTSNDDTSNDETEKYSETNKQLYGCSEGLNATVDGAITTFVDIIDESERMLEEIVKQLGKKPDSFDEDDIDDEIDDLLGDFKEKFEEAINPRLEKVLRQARSDLNSIPSNVKRCVDDVLN